MNAAPQRAPRAALWTKCLIASVALHSVGLYFLMQNPIVISQALAPFFSLTKASPKHVESSSLLDLQQKSLEHFFEEFASPFQKVKSIDAQSIFTASSPLEELSQDITITLPASFFLKERPSAIRSFEETLDSTLLNLKDIPFALESTSIMDPAPSRPNLSEPTLHGISFTFKKQRPLQLHTVPLRPVHDPSKEDLNNASIQSEKLSTLELKQKAYAPTDQLNFSWPDERSLAQVHSSNEVPYISTKASFESLSPGCLSEVNQFLPEHLIAALEWNEDFSVKATVFPDEEGYVFSVAITPCRDLSHQTMKQNFYFLIDSSSDVENHKLSVFKRSVLKALSSLNQGDTFNISLIDKKAQKLSPQNLFVSSKNLQLAESFLENAKGERPLFSSLNLKKNLDELLDTLEAEDEVHTAILLTNGKTSLDPVELSQFLKKNRGRLNLFTAAVGQNNQLTFLDMLSSFAGGSLFYSETNASFPRKLSVFIKSLHAPLAKNLSLSLKASQANAQVSLATASTFMPNLYNESPLMVMGKIDRLCDLDLILQGSSAEDQIFLKKTVHFEEAIEPKSAMKKQWLAHQKSGFYEKFLAEAQPSYLKNAKEILKALYGRTFSE